MLRSELNYYAIENPLGDGRIIAYDYYELLDSLLRAPRTASVRRIVHVSDVGSDCVMEARRFEEGLCKVLEGESGRLRGWKHLIRIGMGISLTYVMFPTLIDVGERILSMVYEWKGPPPTEILIGRIIFGLMLALLPYITCRLLTHGISVRGSTFNALAKTLRKLDHGIDVVESEGLRSFMCESNRLTSEARKLFGDMIYSLRRDDYLEKCAKLINVLKSLHRLARVHGLRGLDMYYYNLGLALYHVKRKVKKGYQPRKTHKILSRIRSGIFMPQW